MRDLHLHLHLHLDSDTHRGGQNIPNYPRDPPGASRNGRSQRPYEISRRAGESTTPHQAKGGTHASRRRGQARMGIPSPSLSKRLKASLNSAIWSSVSWSAMVARARDLTEGVETGSERERERERRSANGGSGREEATRRREDETRSQRPTGLVGSTRHLPVASSAPRGEHGPHLHVTNICISQIQQYYLHPEI